VYVLNPLVSTIYNYIQYKCVAAVRAGGSVWQSAGSAAVCAAVRQCVRQCVIVCSSEVVCGSVQQCEWQCVAVRTAMCGSARCSVQLSGSAAVRGGAPIGNSAPQCAGHCMALCGGAAVCDSVSGSGVRQRGGAAILHRISSISKAQQGGCCAVCAIASTPFNIINQQGVARGGCLLHYVLYHL
jgi:hypothetical protein